MDAYKIIKKHGVPAGVPVVTVYVDEDAVGEYSPRFNHHISLADIVIDIITSDATPFTTATFAKWLFDNGYKIPGSSSGRYPVSNVYCYTSNNIMYIEQLKGIASSNGTAIIYYRTTFTISLGESALNITETSGQSSTIVTSDIVIPL